MSSPHRMANRRPAGRAFTLVELLVVIGIIALLVGILLPVLGKARKQANTLKCLANQKQLMFACVLYANDNRGILPYTGFLDPPVANWCFDNSTPLTGTPKELEGGQMWPYLGDYRLYRCPQDSGPWPNKSVNNLTSYLMNGAMSGYANPGGIGLKITQFHGDDVVFWETAPQKTGLNGANDATNRPQEGIVARHKHGTTVSHIDGHADVMMAKEFSDLCQRGPNVLWCDPTRADGGLSTGGTIPNPIPIQDTN